MKPLTIRELDILRCIANFGYVLERHLAILCGLSLVQMKRVIATLVENDYISTSKILANSGNYVFLTPSAAKAFDVKASNKVNLNTLSHDTLLVDLYFFLINSHDISPELIKTDKQLRREMGIFSSNSQQRVPDLLIDGKIAIELELSLKPKIKLQEIINTYIIDEDIQLVCYFLQSHSLLNKIYQLTLNYPKFRFYLFTLDDNIKFTRLQQQKGANLVTVEQLNLNQLPDTAPKRFGSYYFD